MERTPHFTESVAPRVNARTVAAFLGVKDTTVYALCRGTRGWSRIECLPHHANPDTTKRERYSFDLAAVKEWQTRTGFKVSNAGRGRRLRVKSTNLKQAVVAC